MEAALPTKTLLSSGRSTPVVPWFAVTRPKAGPLSAEQLEDREPAVTSDKERTQTQPQLGLELEGSSGKGH